MAQPLPPLSASVTKILTLSGFAPELKTKDIQLAFAEYDNLKIKWVDDTSLLLVFGDAGVAKRAYLQTISNPPETLHVSPTENSLQIKPYTGPDAAAIMNAVNSRRSNTRGSISMPGNAHVRGMSLNTAITLSAQGGGANMNGNGGVRPGWRGSISEGSGNGPSAPQGLGIRTSPTRDGGSPTLPNLATQPTLNSLINSSLPDIEGQSSSPITIPVDAKVPVTSGVVAPSEGSPVAASSDSTPPRMGDSARRMVGAALGLKHPGLNSRRSLDPTDSLGKAMGGMVIAE